MTGERSGTDTHRDLTSFHEAHGAVFDSVDGRSVVARYRRPTRLERTHRAVRNGVGVIEAPVDVIVVEGSDRLAYVENVVTNRVPTEEGTGCYAFLLDPQGRVTTDMAIYHAGERLLLVTPPGRGAPTVDGWEAFIQDVTFRVATDEFAVFGVHGPAATEKIAGVIDGAGPPETPFAFDRGAVRGAGVTVVRTDAPAGEVGYEVISAADDAVEVFDALLNLGTNAVPFGRETWAALTAEAGTPLFDAELEGRIPNVLGVRAAVDFEKGCFVGQEVVSKVANRGRPSRRLVGLLPEARPEPGAAVFDGDASVGEVTRAVESPSLDRPIALAFVRFDLSAPALSVRVDGEEVPAERTALPFVEGSERSGRLPTYPSATD